MTKKLLLLTVLFTLLVSFPSIQADLKRHPEANRLQNLQAQANSGSVEAQFKMGMAYQFGQGANKNISKAIHWYLLAAEAGHANSQFNLAYLYQVDQQDEKAVYWFRQAAEQELDLAQRALSLMYSEGRGVERNHVLAFQWCYLAAVQGQVDAQFDLGVAFDRGAGVKQDFANAVIWWRAAADQGHANAQFNLGLSYELGEGVEKDDAVAFNWYETAAKQGHTDAQVNLASYYANGIGVPQDFVRAHLWFDLAAKSGHPLAVQSRDYIETRMLEADIQKARTLSRQLVAHSQ